VIEMDEIYMSSYIGRILVMQGRLIDAGGVDPEEVEVYFEYDYHWRDRGWYQHKDVIAVETASYKHEGDPADIRFIAKSLTGESGSAMSTMSGYSYRHNVRMVATNAAGTVKTPWREATYHGASDWYPSGAFVLATNPDNATFHPPYGVALWGSDHVPSFYLESHEGYAVDTGVTPNGCPTGSWEGDIYTTGTLSSIYCIFSWPSQPTTIAPVISRDLDYGDAQSASINWSESQDSLLSRTYEEPEGVAPFSTELAYASHDLQMTNTDSGEMALSTTPAGSSESSTITADGIEALAVTTNAEGEATLGGSVGGSSFSVLTDKNGNSVIQYDNGTDANTTLSLPHPNDITIGEDGTITATHGDKTVTIHPDGTTTYEDRFGTGRSQQAGESLIVTEGDVLVDTTYTVTYKPNYTGSPADTVKELAYGSNPSGLIPQLERGNYQLEQWSPDVSYLTQDENITAHWRPKPGHIDVALLATNANAGTPANAPINYINAAGQEQNTTLSYYDDSVNTPHSRSGGNGADLTHSLSFSDRYVDVTSHTDGNTSIATQPGKSGAVSSFMAEGISPIAIDVENAGGDVNVSGSATEGTTFEAITHADGTTTLTYTNADGIDTVLNLPYPNDIVVHKDGTITATNANGDAITLHPDGSTRFVDQNYRNQSVSPEAGVDINMTADAIQPGITYTVEYDLLGGVTGGGELSQSVGYGLDAATPSNPTRTDYTFDGWDGNQSYIVSDRTIYALWAPDKPNIIDPQTHAQPDGGNWYTKPINYQTPQGDSGTHTLKYYDAQDGSLSVDVSGGGESQPLEHRFEYDTHEVALTNHTDSNTTLSLTPQGGGEPSTVTTQGIDAVTTTVDESGRAVVNGSVGDIRFESITDTEGNTQVTYTDSNGKETIVDAPYASHVLIDENGKLTLTTGSINPDGSTTLADGEKSVVIEDTTTTVTEREEGADRSVTLSGYETIDVSADYVVVVVFDPLGGVRTGGGTLSQEIESGTDATPPVIERNCSDGSAGCFSFAGWDSAYDMVTSDLSIKASWEAANGVIDTLTPARSAGGNWHTKALDYNTSGAAEQNTTLRYYQDSGVDVNISGGDKGGDALVHTFSGYSDGQTVALENHSDGNTRFATTPEGQSEPSTITAEGLSPIDAQVDEEGVATLSGTLDNGSHFEVTTRPDGTTTVRYTNADGKVTTTHLPYKNDVLIGEDGTLTLTTADAQEVSLGADGSATFSDKNGNPQTAPAGQSLSVTGDDVLWVDKHYTVTFEENGGTLNSGDRLQSVAYASSAVAPNVTRENYTLSWDKAFDYITANLVVTAKWIPGDGVIDPQALKTTVDGDWITKPIDYKNSDGEDQNTTLTYFDDGSTNLSLSGGDGDALVHTFSGYTDNQTVELSSHPDGKTAFHLTPDGQMRPSSITADQISPIEAKVDADGAATLTGEVAGSSFEVITQPDGSTTVRYTNAGGKVTTTHLPYKNDVSIKEDGTLTATHDGQKVTIAPDGSATFTDKTGTPQSVPAGEDLSVTGEDVIWDTTFAIAFKPNGGTRDSGGALSQSVNYAADALDPVVSRGGYTFVRWEGGARTYITADRNFTALWNPDPGTIDPDIDTTREGSWYTKPVAYTDSNEEARSTTLQYYDPDDGTMDLTASGGNGADLIHTFDYKSGHPSDGLEVQLTNETGGDTRLESTPSGEATPSTLTAEGLSPLEAGVDEQGRATLSGSVMKDGKEITFEAVTDEAGNVEVRYTDSNGKTRTITAPHPSDVVISPDGNVTITNGDRVVALKDTETAITTEPGKTIEIAQNGPDEMDISGNFEFEVNFDPNGGTLISGDLNQTVAIGEKAQEPGVKRAHFDFDGWDSGFDMVQMDLNISAKWSAHDGVIDPAPSATDRGGDWHMKPILYNTSSGDYQAALLNYYDPGDATLDLAVSGGLGADLIHTFNYGAGHPSRGLKTALINRPDGDTRFEVTPNGGVQGPSSVTAKGISPVEAEVDENGTATLSGSTKGVDFEVITAPDGTIALTHTSPDGKRTTLESPYASDVVISEDGTLTLTHDGATTTIHPDGTVEDESSEAEEDGASTTPAYGVTIGESTSLGTTTEQHITATSQNGQTQQVALVQEGIDAPYYQALSGDAMTATTAYATARDGDPLTTQIVTSAKEPPNTTIDISRYGAQQAGWTSYADNLTIAPQSDGQVDLNSSATLPGGGVSTLKATLYGPEGQSGYTHTNSAGTQTNATAYLPVEGTTEADGTTRLAGEDFNVTTYPGGTGLVQMAHGADDNLSSISLDEPGSTTVIKEDGNITITYPKDDGSGEVWTVELGTDGTIAYTDSDGNPQTLPAGSSLGFSSAGVATISSSQTLTEAHIIRDNPGGSQSDSALIVDSNDGTTIDAKSDGSFETARTDAGGNTISGSLSPTGQSTHRVRPASGAAETTAQSQIPGTTTTLDSDGISTAVGNLSDGSGGRVDLNVSATGSGAATHEMRRTDSNGTQSTITATSQKPGANTTLATDGEGKPYLKTTLTSEDKQYQIEATADNQASHSLTAGGLTTRADTEVVSADIQTIIDEAGSIETTVRPTGKEGVRAIIQTLSNGESLTRFERYNEATAKWEVILPTVDESTPFEAGNQSRIKERSDELEIEVTSDVTRILKF
jgi:hypothetical protein